MAHREPTDWVNRTLETDTCWKEVSFRKGKVSKGWLFAAFVLSWQSPFSWEEGTESLLWPQEGILHYVCRKCGLLRISALNTCGSTSAFLEVWGIEEDGRDGFIGTRSPSCLQGNPENSARPPPVESTRGQRKVPSVFFQGSEPPCGLSFQRYF